MPQQISFVVEVQQSLSETQSRGRAERCRKSFFGTLFTTLTLLLGLALCGQSALAQSGAGSIQGTVTDSAGAVIVGASIHVVNQNTGATNDGKSNSTGFYQVPGLFTGIYVVSITAPSMKTYNQTLELLVGQNAVINISLSPGAVTQQVTVKANAVQLVETDNGTLSSTLENGRINDLPMNGRSISGLVNETTPGFESCSSGTCADGGESSALEYVADGVPLTNMLYGGDYEGGTQLVDPDAIQEVQVNVADSGAEFATPTTAVMTTKSGTNQLHGSLFETARNNGFGIARGRSNPTSYVAPQLVRNEFGVSVGGPIVIPHLYHGKNKSFFFFAYERYSLAQGADDSFTVPTQAMRNGDFSGLTSANVLQELYDPNTTASSASCAEPSSAGTATFANTWCRQPFANNYIPPSRESPLTVVLNKMTPLPTTSGNPLASTGNATNLIQRLPTFNVEPQITFRLDRDFNEDNRAYLRYTQNIFRNTQPHSAVTGGTVTAGESLTAGDIPAGASNTASHPYATFGAALGFTHIFSPTFFSETILSQMWQGEYSYAAGDPGRDYESELGLPNNFGETGFPFIENIFFEMEGSQWVYGMSSKISQADENLTKTVGRHQLLFGGRYRLEQLGAYIDKSTDTVLFNGNGTALENPSSGSSTLSPYSNSGQTNADEFLGSAETYNVLLNAPYVHLRSQELDGYLQDNYRIRRNLTLNLGLRYEMHPAVWAGNGLMVGFDLKNDAQVLGTTTTQLIAEHATTQAIISNMELDGAKFETPAEAGWPAAMANNYDFTWGPRIGVAWQPFGKWGTVLRGGFGRYIFPNPARVDYYRIHQTDPFVVSYTEGYDSASYAPDSLPNYALRSVLNSSPGYSYSSTLAGEGVPVMGLNSANAVNNTTTTALQPGYAGMGISRDYAPYYSSQTNFTLEQPLKWNSVLRVSYVYTHGSNLHNALMFNEHPSTFAWEVQTGTKLPTSSTIGPTNSNTGAGPYDQTTWGDVSAQMIKTGWSNYNALQATYQKLYHSGVAWQVLYVWSKLLRTGVVSPNSDNGGLVDVVDPYSSYSLTGPATVTYAPEGGTMIAPNLPPPPPAGVPSWGYYKALNRFENYMVDSSNPPQHLQFNAAVDLPFGHGKWLLGNANKPLNEVVGGWQLAGAGSVITTDFPVLTTNWGPTAPLKVYKKSVPITDCRTGVCVKGYEWWNGYLAPTVVSGNTCSGGLATVVNGLPSSWKPYQTPIDTICSAPVNGKAVTDSYYGTNDVIMNGVTGQSANAVEPYADVPSGNQDNGELGAIAATNPFSHTFLNGPMVFEADLSLFKVLPITERMSLRFNMDAFNVFNIQGLNNPSSTDGTVLTQSGGVGATSRNTPRQLQFTARLSF